MNAPRAAVAVLALSLAACGKSSSPTGSGEKPFSGWVPVDGMICADGSPTGLGVLPGRADRVLFYLSPGGACWGDAACPSSVLRRFGSLEYTFVQTYARGTIFDRALPGNPFADWTVVFVPYCTGDVHAGRTVKAHGAETWNHHGWANLQAAVAETTTRLARPAEVVVAGSSAGGFGSLAAYDLVRAEWDPAGGTTAMLLDDSAQTFIGAAMSPALLARWWDVWGLGSTIGTICPGCATDLSQIWPTLHGRHLDDRLALVSTEQDATMIGFFADPEIAVSPLTPLQFQADVDALAGNLAGLGPNVAMYRVGGASAQRHALLDDATFLDAANPQGPALLAWVSSMVALDPAWTSSTSP